jgi:hypothetical protein
MVKFIFTCSLILFSFFLFAQENTKSNKVLLEKQEYLLSELLNEIHLQTGKEFSYTSELNTGKRVKLSNPAGTIKEILSRVIDLKAFKIREKDDKVYLIAIPPHERKYTISGFVSDAESGEVLINATIANMSEFSGTVSNNFGFYSLSLKNSSHQLQFSFVGYENATFDVNLSNDTTFNIALKPKTILKEVKVTADNRANNINHLFVSTNTMSAKELNQNGVFGESDLFKNLMQLPGVQSPQDGLGGLIIRNGSPDQNLILLDDVPVYYTSHLLGLYSIFNPDAINNVKLIKGGFPAHYGGRVSSVMDIRMRDGNTKRIGGDYSIGLLTAKFNLNGPIKKDKTTFNISMRRSYLDLILNGILELADSDVKAGYYFGDLNWKIVHRFSHRDKLYFSSYWGGDMARVKTTDVISDQLSEKNTVKIGWGNFTNSLRWNHIYNRKLFGNTSLILSRYTFLSDDKVEEKRGNGKYKENYKYHFKSGIRDFSFKTEFDWIPDQKHYLKFGMEASLHHTKPGSEIVKNRDNSGLDIDTDKKIKSQEINLYGECQIRFGKKFLVNMGTRWSSFFVEKTYYSTIEPRLNSQYFITPKWSVTGSFSQMTQYLHLVTTSSISMPTDIWLPVTKKIKPIDAFQYTGGTHYSFSKSVKLSIEGYHKLSRNILEFKETAYLQDIRSNWENQVESGKGWSKGLEMNLSKSMGTTTGSISYTLARARVRFQNLNDGKSFASPYDRRHAFSVFMKHKVSKKINLSAFWTYGTGLPATVPNATIPAISPYENNMVSNTPVFTERNAYRLSDYHRLDLSINFVKKKKRGTRTWNISVYNLYNRKNTSYVYLKDKSESPGNYTLRKVSLFSLLPSVSYSYKF